MVGKKKKTVRPAELQVKKGEGMETKTPTQKKNIWPRKKGTPVEDSGPQNGGTPGTEDGRSKKEGKTEKGPGQG